MLIEENNEILRSKLAKMNLLNSQLIKYEKENQELKKLLNYFKEQPLLLQIGKVVNSDNSFLSRTLIINLGLNDSIKENSPVVDINGLIGRVVAVGDKASQVQLISDKNFIVSVRLGKDMSVGEFKSTHKGLEAGIYSSSSSPFSWDGGEYPSGVYVYQFNMSTGYSARNKMMLIK